MPPIYFTAALKLVEVAFVIVKGVYPAACPIGSNVLVVPFTLSLPPRLVLIIA